MAKRVNAWHTPNTMPEGTVCRSLFIPESDEWLAIVSGALAELTLPYRWEAAGAITPQQAAERMTEMLQAYYDSECGSNPDAPFWDDADGDDADGDEESPFSWYEDVADWVVTAFLATSFTPAAATTFVTTARKIRLAFRTANWGALADIFVNDVLLDTVDTYSPELGVIENEYDLTTVLGEALAAQAADDITLKIVHAGEANDAAVAAASGYGISIIRKRLQSSVFPPSASSPMVGRIFRLSLGGKLQYSDTGGTIWEDADTLPEYQSPAPRTEAAAADKICMASRNAAEVFRLAYETVLEAHDEGTSEIGIVDAVAGIVATVLGTFFAPAWLAYAAVSWVLVSGVLLALEVLTSADWDEAVTETLTCALLEVATVDATGRVSFDWNALRWNTAKAADIRILGFINLMMDAIGADGLNTAGATTSVTEYDCACGVWCFEFTPTSSPSLADWQIHIKGTWTGTVWDGVVSTAGGSSYNDSVGLTWDMGEPITITALEAEYNLVQGGGNSPAVLYFSDRAPNGTGNTIFANFASGYGSAVVRRWEGERTLRYLGAWANAARAQTAAALASTISQIKRIKVEGVGKNPFGASNCIGE